MKKDEAIEIALSVGAVIEFGRAKVFYTHKELQDFATEVERRTLERAAVVCDVVVINHPGRADLTALQCANEIRALKEVL